MKLPLYFLMETRGFHGALTSRIAKTAGVVNGTLFQYFPTKEKLILPALIWIKEELREYFEKHLVESLDAKQSIKFQIVILLARALEHRTKFDFLQ
ncbi:TetR/AcrR family transcriptional regulator [Aquimarina sp. ERC-38]|uniref:TetR/AcrR family transcriptional regulator n=1 Tax=Aquimarina sp. ERC-38 TaxID=2949996 RepID=UPI002247D524|nr:TetR/AcrR family transcriptional regulator [Aquimarina sp. ERC-38]UZO80608.1 TetR/AcrR family transcriptional regulator [Aquimarina sp. ERC-38]